MLADCRDGKVDLIITKSISRFARNTVILLKTVRELKLLGMDIFLEEKYNGDALLQKGFTVDFLTKKRKPNEGEVPQYYVQNSHPAIIEPDEFDAVQAEMQRCKGLGRPCGCGSPFSAKIVCGECGGYYGSKVWGSNTKYRRVIWRCNEKYKGDKKCKTPHVTEDNVKQRFLAAFNTLMGVRDE